MSYILHLYDAEEGHFEDRKLLASARVDTWEEAVEVRQWLRGLEVSEDRELSEAARSLYVVTDHVPDVVTALAAKEKIMDSDPFLGITPEVKKSAVKRRHSKS